MRASFALILMTFVACGPPDIRPAELSVSGDAFSAGDSIPISLRNTTGRFIEFSLECAEPQMLIGPEQWAEAEGGWFCLLEHGELQPGETAVSQIPVPADAVVGIHRFALEIRFPNVGVEQVLSNEFSIR